MRTIIVSVCSILLSAGCTHFKTTASNIVELADGTQVQAVKVENTKWDSIDGLIVHMYERHRGESKMQEVDCLRQTDRGSLKYLAPVITGAELAGGEIGSSAVLRPDRINNKTVQTGASTGSISSVTASVADSHPTAAAVANPQVHMTNGQVTGVLTNVRPSQITNQGTNVNQGTSVRNSAHGGDNATNVGVQTGRHNGQTVGGDD